RVGPAGPGKTNPTFRSVPNGLTPFPWKTNPRDTGRSGPTCARSLRAGRRGRVGKIEPRAPPRWSAGCFNRKDDPNGTPPGDPRFTTHDSRPSPSLLSRLRPRTVVAKVPGSASLRDPEDPRQDPRPSTGRGGCGRSRGPRLATRAEPALS